MKPIICILCPRGCQLSIDSSNNVIGNFCPKGRQYYYQETQNPIRTLTSTVFISNRKDIVLPVRSNKPIPKDKMFEVMQIINQIEVTAPITVGSVVYKNILGLSIDIIASKTIL